LVSTKTGVADMMLGLATVPLLALAGLGPGPKEWQVDTPENHGLDSAKLKAAAELTARVAPERYCLLVIKDGYLIQESYFGNSSEALYETDSLGKTVTAALFGSLVQEGLLDIDRPIHEYGVKPTTHFDYGHSWGSFFPNVTTRSLLAQSSGYGVVAPGTEFTYDSEEYIQHLSYVLSAVVKNGTALSYAQAWAKKMGMEGYFDFDDVGDDQGGPTQISAGGGQMVSCREIARVGQLINNKGVWLDAAGKPFQLASADYVEQMVKPAYPGLIDGYGLLTWLNTDMTKPYADGTKPSHCCGPRWNVRGAQSCAKAPSGVQKCGACCKAVGSYNGTQAPCLPGIPVIPEFNGGVRAPSAGDPCEVVAKSIVGDSFPDADWHPAPPDLAFGMGQWAKYVYALPSANLTVVSMGQSKGTSLDCDGSYNDGYTLSLIWRVMEEAMGVGPKQQTKPQPPPPRSRQPAPRTAEFVPGNGRGRELTRASIQAEQAAHDAAAAALAASGEAGPIGACCTCVCPPSQGFGQGFGVPSAIAAKHPLIKEGGSCPRAVTELFPDATSLCPYIGYVQQCLHTEVGQQTCDYSSGGGGGAGDLMCAMVPGSKELATSGCYMPLSDEWEECVWTKGACPYTPYYPVTNLTEATDDHPGQ
jgi:CubicO group peptidase (beta-lactamase class C family)